MPDVTVNGLKLHYEAAGQGDTTLVCLHGISSNSRSWRHQLAGLAERYRVIAWDAPGYGRSDDPPGPFAMSYFADQLAGLLAALGLEKAVIVGLSMGGVVAQEFYRRHASKVSALVLADTNTGGGARPEQERNARLEARLKAIETLTPAEMARQRAPNLLSPSASPELVREVEAMISEIHPLGFRYAAIALDGADTREVLPNITVPALVLWGDQDTVTPLAEAQTLHAAIPGAQLEIIPGAGHLSNLEQPATFNRLVTAFFNK
jgi:pimeloyl-ACP methyl ester carboxylesterase